MLNAESVRKMYQDGAVNKIKKNNYDKYSAVKRKSIAIEAQDSSVIEVANKYEVTATSIYSWMKKYGVTGGNTNKRYTNLEKRTIIEYSYRHSLIETKERFNVGQQTVCRWRQELTA